MVNAALASSTDAVSATLPVYEFDASKSRFAFAWSDLKTAFARPRLILTLVNSSFKRKYQGTILGGFWITLTTLMTVTGLALLYGQIFNSPRADYFPYVAIGIVFWGVISGMINDAASVFLASAPVFTQMPLSKSLFALRAIGVSCITLGFKLLVAVGVIVWYSVPVSAVDLLLSFLGLLLILWTGFWFSLGLGTIGARFRDIGQLTAAFATLAFFITPVFWQTSRLGEYQFVADYNPLYHILNTVRGPLLGLDGVATSFAWSIGVAILTTVFGGLIFGLFARRLCYWS